MANNLYPNGIFIDVTEAANVPYMTGIQRVTKELSIRLVKSNSNVRMVEYDEFHQAYHVITTDSYLDKMTGKASEMKYEGYLKIEDMCAGQSFIDMDSVWNNYVLRRQNLYKQLHEQGVKIASMVYDIIPVTYPQYCHQETTFHFLLWLSAVLEYSDFVFVNTEATRQKLLGLCDKLNLQPKKVYIAPLGANFKQGKEIANTDNISTKVLTATEKPYVLMLGTLEPRKNHILAVQAIHGSLINENINLIIAGRNGWNMEKFLEDIKQDPLFDKRIFYLESPTDAEVTYLYEKTLALIIASHEEGYGLPIIEAFHFGKPVLASDIDVFREVGGECAVYFDKDDEKSLGEKVMQLMQDEKLYESLVTQIKDYKAPDWDESAAIIDEYIKEECEAC